MNVVVDANIVIKWYVEEIHTAKAELLVDEKFELLAPELLLPEFGNILWKKCRNDDLDEKTAENALKDFQARQITLYSHKRLLRPAYKCARTHGQAVYDWIYLALALSLNYPFVTADRKFYIAARKTPFAKNVVWVENIPDLI